MTKLSQIVIPRSNITAAPGQEFTVRGLNLIDLMLLLADYSPAMLKVFTDFQAVHQASGSFSVEDTKALLLQAIKEVPELVCAAIAMAADEYTPEAVENVRNLPLAVQADALEQIVVLSIRSEGELKKLQEIAVRWTETAAAMIAPSLSRYMAGSGKSARG